MSKQKKSAYEGMMFAEGEALCRCGCGHKVEVLMTGEEEEEYMRTGKPVAFIGQFKRGPFKGKYYTKGAEIARSIKKVTDSNRRIEATPERVQ